MATPSIEPTTRSASLRIVTSSMFHLAAWLVLGSIVASSSGCISLMANVIRVIKGTDLPAEFDEFPNKKVAVVATTAAGINADATGIIISNQVHSLLAFHVKKIQMINQDEVARIVNDEPASSRDMTMLGSRMGADFLVVVDVSDLKLRDGQTLYKGSSNSNIAVYKVGDGTAPVFRKALNGFVFPQMGVPITDTDEATFHRFYLSEVANRLARCFYPYDPTTDVAKDAAAASLSSFR